jgi:cell division protein FtsW
MSTRAGFNAGRSIIIITFALVFFGLIILSSAGVVEGQKRFDSSYYYISHQFLYGFLPGLMAFFVLSRIDYNRWKKIALPILFFAILLMVAVFIPGVGQQFKGAQRWIAIGPITFQPAEFLKLALIVYLAAWLSARNNRFTNPSYSLAPFAIVLALVALLLLLQPDFGTLGLIVIIGVAMYFLSGAKLRHFLAILVIFGIVLGGLAFASPYRFNRIKTFLNPTQDALGTSYHINQALIGIGSGGIFGVGFGRGQQKTNFLPEPVGDSIFAVLVEELGFVGGAVLIALFLALFFSLLRVAKKCTNEFAKLFLLGLGVWIVVQAFINIGAITGIIPLTGLPLPFVSFGGSSMMSLMAAMGIAVNIARQN